LLAESFNRSAAAWPRPIREQRPFLGLVEPAEPLPLPRNFASVSGPPLALAAALITSATKVRGFRRMRAPRSRMRPGRGRKSELSSRLMPAISPHAIKKTTEDRPAAHCRQQKQRFGGDEAALSKTHL
jgi:hypothetical protein